MSRKIADRRNFLKGSMAGDAGFVVGSTTPVAIGAESGKKIKPVLAANAYITNKVDVLA